MLEIDADEIKQVKSVPGISGAVEVTFDDGSQRIFTGDEAQEILKLWAEFFKPGTSETPSEA